MESATHLLRLGATATLDPGLITLTAYIDIAANCVKKGTENVHLKIFLPMQTINEQTTKVLRDDDPMEDECRVTQQHAKTSCAAESGKNFGSDLIGHLDHGVWSSLSDLTSTFASCLFGYITSCPM